MRNPEGSSGLVWVGNRSLVTLALVAPLACVAGCAPAADEELAAPLRSPSDVCVMPLPESLPPAPAVADSFWTYEREDEASRPRPRLSRTISLGYVGDEPLAGGVTRETSMEPPAQGPGMTWQQYVRQPSWPPPPERGPSYPGAFYTYAPRY